MTTLRWFPEVSRNFVNSFSGTIKYVDADNGSNSNGGDTISAAYQTIEYAQSQTSAISTAVMYVINPGTYTVTPVTSGSSSAAIYDGNLPRIFFCAPDGRVVIQWTAGTPRDAPIVNFQNAGSAVYGAVFLRNNAGKTLNYSVAMFNGSTGYTQGDFYNCVFRETNANGNWSLQYDNSSVNNSTVNNCSFYTIENGDSDYSGGTGLVLNNCAFNYTYGAGSAVKNNTVINQTIDPTSYELTVDNSTYGVYSGTYAWGQPRTFIDLQISGQSVTAANEGQTVTVAVGSSLLNTTLNYTITGVSSADINGASLTGTVNIVNGEGSFNIVLSEDVTSNEGTETLTVTVADPSGDLVISLTVYDTSAILFVTPAAVPRDTITVRLNTSNTPETDGTQIPYTISGTYITEELLGVPLTGNFTVNNNVAEFTIVLPSIVSTTLTVAAYGETADCVITFNLNITDEVIDMDTYIDLEVSTPAFSLLPLSAISIADSSSNDDPEQTGSVYINPGNYLDVALVPLITQTNQGDLGNDTYPGGLINFTYVAAPVTVTETTETGGLLDVYVVRPLGQELIREYWI